MDFSILLSDLRDVAEKYKGKTTEPQVSTLAYVDMFTKILRRAQKATDNYDDQITVLWVALNQLASIYKDLSAGMARDQLCRFIFGMCARTVLNIQWAQLDEDNKIKKNFSATVENVHEILSELGFPKFQLILDLMESHWTHPTLSQIMSGEEEIEGGLEYIQKEDPDILKLRIEIMIKENCEEFALNLCEWSLKHPSLREDLKIKENQIFMLYKQAEYGKMQEVCETIICHDGIKVMSHLAKTPTNQALCIRLAQVFLIQDWVKKDRTCCTQELLKLWIHHQYLADKDEERFLDSIWTVAKVCRDTEQIGVLIDGVRKECGDMFIQLYTDLCKFAINIDKGNMEREETAGNEEGVKHRKMCMTKTCLRMANMLKEYDFKISRVCGLTAFALDPTTENLNLVNKLYWTIKNTSATSENSKINPATIYEVERLLNLMRPELLNPDYSWKQLIPICKRYKLESAKGYPDQENFAESVKKEGLLLPAPGPSMINIPNKLQEKLKADSKSKQKIKKPKEPKTQQDLQKAHVERMLSQNKKLSREQIEKILSDQFPRNAVKELSEGPALDMKQLDKTIDDLKKSIYLETKYRQHLEQNLSPLSTTRKGGTQKSAVPSSTPVNSLTTSHISRQEQFQNNQKQKGNPTQLHRQQSLPAMGHVSQSASANLLHRQLSRPSQGQGQTQPVAAHSHPRQLTSPVHMFGTSPPPAHTNHRVMSPGASYPQPPTAHRPQSASPTGGRPLHSPQGHSQGQRSQSQYGTQQLTSSNQPSSYSSNINSQMYKKIHTDLLLSKQLQPTASSHSRLSHPNILRPAGTPKQECAKIAQQIAEMHERQRAEKDRLERMRIQGQIDGRKAGLNARNIPTSSKITDLLSLTLKCKTSSGSNPEPQNTVIDQAASIRNSMDQSKRKFEKKVQGSPLRPGDAKSPVGCPKYVNMGSSPVTPVPSTHNDHIPSSQLQNVNSISSQLPTHSISQWSSTSPTVTVHRPRTEAKTSQSPQLVSSGNSKQTSKTMKTQKCYLTTDKKVMDQLKQGNMNVKDSQLSIKPVFSMIVPKSMTNPANQEELVKTVKHMVKNVQPSQKNKVIKTERNTVPKPQEIQPRPTQTAKLVNNQSVPSQNTMQYTQPISIKPAICQQQVLLPSTVQTSPTIMGVLNPENLQNNIMSVLGQQIPSPSANIQPVQHLYNPTQIQQTDTIQVTPLYDNSQQFTPSLITTQQSFIAAQQFGDVQQQILVSPHTNPSFAPSAIQQVVTVQNLAAQNFPQSVSTSTPAVNLLCTQQPNVDMGGFSSLGLIAQSGIDPQALGMHQNHQQPTLHQQQPIQLPLQQAHQQTIQQSQLQQSLSTHDAVNIPTVVNQSHHQFIAAPELSSAVLEQILSSLKKTGAKALAAKQSFSVPSVVQNFQQRNIKTADPSVLEATKKILKMRKQYEQTDGKQTPAFNSPKPAISKTSSTTQVAATISPKKGSLLQKMIESDINLEQLTKTPFGVNKGVSPTKNVSLASSQPVNQSAAMNSSIPDLPDLGLKEFEIDSILSLDTDGSNNSVPTTPNVVQQQKEAVINEPIHGPVTEIPVLKATSDQDMLMHISQLFAKTENETQTRTDNARRNDAVRHTADQKLVGTPFISKSNQTFENRHVEKLKQSTYLNANRIGKERETNSASDGSTVAENHVDSVEVKSCVSKCPRCGGLFKTKQHLELHMDLCPQRHHVMATSSEGTFKDTSYSDLAGIQPAVCNICGLKLPTMFALKEHIKYTCVKHRPKSPCALKDYEYSYVYKCSQCNLMNANKKTTSNHVEKCMLMFPFKGEMITMLRCQMCSDMFTDKDSCYRHVSKLCPQKKAISTQQEVQNVYDRLKSANMIQHIADSEAAKVVPHIAKLIDGHNVGSEPPHSSPKSPHGKSPIMKEASQVVKDPEVKETIKPEKANPVVKNVDKHQHIPSVKNSSQGQKDSNETVTTHSGTKNVNKQKKDKLKDKQKKANDKAVNEKIKQESTTKTENTIKGSESTNKSNKKTKDKQDDNTNESTQKKSESTINEDISIKRKVKDGKKIVYTGFEEEAKRSVPPTVIDNTSDKKSDGKEHLPKEKNAFNYNDTIHTNMGGQTVPNDESVNIDACKKAKKEREESEKFYWEQFNAMEKKKREIRERKLSEVKLMKKLKDAMELKEAYLLKEKLEKEQKEIAMREVNREKYVHEEIQKIKSNKSSQGRQVSEVKNSKFERERKETVMVKREKGEPDERIVVTKKIQQKHEDKKTINENLVPIKKEPVPIKKEPNLRKEKKIDTKAKKVKSESKEDNKEWTTESESEESNRKPTTRRNPKQKKNFTINRKTSMRAQRLLKKQKLVKDEIVSLRRRAKKENLKTSELNEILDENLETCKFCHKHFRRLGTHYIQKYNIGFKKQRHIFRCRYCTYTTAYNGYYDIKKHVEKEHMEILLKQINGNKLFPATPEKKDFKIKAKTSPTKPVPVVRKVDFTRSSMKGEKLRKHLKAVAMRKKCAEKLRSIASKKALLDEEDHETDRVPLENQPEADIREDIDIKTDQIPTPSPSPEKGRNKRIERKVTKINADGRRITADIISNENNEQQDNDSKTKIVLGRPRKYAKGEEPWNKDMVYDKNGKAWVKRTERIARGRGISPTSITDKFEKPTRSRSSSISSRSSLNEMSSIVQQVMSRRNREKSASIKISTVDKEDEEKMKSDKLMLTRSGRIIQRPETDSSYVTESSMDEETANESDIETEESGILKSAQSISRRSRRLSEKNPGKEMYDASDDDSDNEHEAVVARLTRSKIADSPKSLKGSEIKKNTKNSDGDDAKLDSTHTNEVIKLRRRSRSATRKNVLRNPILTDDSTDSEVTFNNESIQRSLRSLSKDRKENSLESETTDVQTEELSMEAEEKMGTNESDSKEASVEKESDHSENDSDDQSDEPREYMLRKRKRSATNTDSHNDGISPGKEKVTPRDSDSEFELPVPKSRRRSLRTRSKQQNENNEETGPTLRTRRNSGKLSICTNEEDSVKDLKTILVDPDEEFAGLQVSPTKTKEIDVKSNTEENKPKTVLVNPDEEFGGLKNSSIEETNITEDECIDRLKDDSEQTEDSEHIVSYTDDELSDLPTSPEKEVSKTSKVQPEESKTVLIGPEDDFIGLEDVPIEDKCVINVSKEAQKDKPKSVLIDPEDEFDGLHSLPMEDTYEKKVKGNNTEQTGDSVKTDINNKEAQKDKPKSVLIDPEDEFDGLHSLPIEDTKEKKVKGNNTEQTGDDVKTDVNSKDANKSISLKAASDALQDLDDELAFLASAPIVNTGIKGEASKETSLNKSFEGKKDSNFDSEFLRFSKTTQYKEKYNLTECSINVNSFEVLESLEAQKHFAKQKLKVSDSTVNKISKRRQTSGKNVKSLDNISDKDSKKTDPSDIIIVLDSDDDSDVASEMRRQSNKSPKQSRKQLSANKKAGPKNKELKQGPILPGKENETLIEAIDTDLIISTLVEGDLNLIEESNASSSAVEETINVKKQVNNAEKSKSSILKKDIPSLKEKIHVTINQSNDELDDDVILIENPEIDATNKDQIIKSLVNRTDLRGSDQQNKSTSKTAKSTDEISKTVKNVTEQLLDDIVILCSEKTEEINTECVEVTITATVDEQMGNNENIATDVAQLHEAELDESDMDIIMIEPKESDVIKVNNLHEINIDLQTTECESSKSEDITKSEQYLKIIQELEQRDKDENVEKVPIKNNDEEAIASSNENCTEVVVSISTDVKELDDLVRNPELEPCSEKDLTEDSSNKTEQIESNQATPNSTPEDNVESYETVKDGESMDIELSKPISLEDTVIANEVEDVKSNQTVEIDQSNEESRLSELVSIDKTQISNKYNNIDNEEKQLSENIISQNNSQDEKNTLNVNVKENKLPEVEQCTFELDAQTPINNEEISIPQADITCNLGQNEETNYTEDLQSADILTVHSKEKQTDVRNTDRIELKSVEDNDFQTESTGILNKETSIITQNEDAFIAPDTSIEEGNAIPETNIDSINSPDNTEKVIDVTKTEYASIEETNETDLNLIAESNLLCENEDSPSSNQGTIKTVVTEKEYVSVEETELNAAKEAIETDINIETSVIKQYKMVPFELSAETSHNVPELKVSNNENTSTDKNSEAMHELNDVEIQKVEENTVRVIVDTNQPTSESISEDERQSILMENEDTINNDASYKNSENEHNLLIINTEPLFMEAVEDQVQQSSELAEPLIEQELLHEEHILGSDVSNDSEHISFECHESTSLDLQNETVEENENDESEVKIEELKQPNPESKHIGNDVTSISILHSPDVEINLNESQQKDEDNTRDGSDGHVMEQGVLHEENTLVNEVSNEGKQISYELQEISVDTFNQIEISCSLDSQNKTIEENVKNEVEIEVIKHQKLESVHIETDERSQLQIPHEELAMNKICKHLEGEGANEIKGAESINKETVTLQNATQTQNIDQEPRHENVEETENLISDVEDLKEQEGTFDQIEISSSLDSYNETIEENVKNKVEIEVIKHQELESVYIETEERSQLQIPHEDLAMNETCKHLDGEGANEMEDAESINKKTVTLQNATQTQNIDQEPRHEIVKETENPISDVEDLKDQEDVPDQVDEHFTEDKDVGKVDLHPSQSLTALQIYNDSDSESDVLPLNIDMEIATHDGNTLQENISETIESKEDEIRIREHEHEKIEQLCEENLVVDQKATQHNSDTYSELEMNYDDKCVEDDVQNNFSTLTENPDLTNEDVMNAEVQVNYKNVISSKANELEEIEKLQNVELSTIEHVEPCNIEEKDIIPVEEEEHQSGILNLPYTVVSLEIAENQERSVNVEITDIPLPLEPDAGIVQTSSKDQLEDNHLANLTTEDVSMSSGLIIPTIQDETNIVTTQSKDDEVIEDNISVTKQEVSGTVASIPTQSQESEIESERRDVVEVVATDANLEETTAPEKDVVVNLENDVHRVTALELNYRNIVSNLGNDSDSDLSVISLISMDGENDAIHDKEATIETEVEQSESFKRDAVNIEHTLTEQLVTNTNPLIEENIHYVDNDGDKPMVESTDDTSTLGTNNMSHNEDQNIENEVSKEAIQVLDQETQLENEEELEQNEISNEPDHQIEENSLSEKVPPELYEDAHIVQLEVESMEETVIEETMIEETVIEATILEDTIETVSVVETEHIDSVNEKCVDVDAQQLVNDSSEEEDGKKMEESRGDQIVDTQFQNEPSQYAEENLKLLEKQDLAEKVLDATIEEKITEPLQFANDMNIENTCAEVVIGNIDVPEIQLTVQRSATNIKDDQSTETIDETEPENKKLQFEEIEIPLTVSTEEVCLGDSERANKEVTSDQTLKIESVKEVIEAHEPDIVLTEHILPVDNAVNTDQRMEPSTLNVESNEECTLNKTGEKVSHLEEKYETEVIDTESCLGENDILVDKPSADDVYNLKESDLKEPMIEKQISEDDVMNSNLKLEETSIQSDVEQSVDVQCDNDKVFTDSSILDSKSAMLEEAHVKTLTKDTSRVKETLDKDTSSVKDLISIDVASDRELDTQFINTDIINTEGQPKLTIKGSDNIASVGNVEGSDREQSDMEVSSTVAETTLGNTTDGHAAMSNEVNVETIYKDTKTVEASKDTEANNKDSIDSGSCQEQIIKGHNDLQGVSVTTTVENEEASKSLSKEHQLNKKQNIDDKSTNELEETTDLYVVATKRSSRLREKPKKDYKIVNLGKEVKTKPETKVQSTDMKAIQDVPNTEHTKTSGKTVEEHSKKGTNKGKESLSEKKHDTNNIVSAKTESNKANVDIKGKVSTRSRDNSKDNNEKIVQDVPNTEHTKTSGKTVEEHSKKGTNKGKESLSEKVHDTNNIVSAKTESNKANVDIKGKVSTRSRDNSKDNNEKIVKSETDVINENSGTTRPRSSTRSSIESKEKVKMLESAEKIVNEGKRFSTRSRNSSKDSIDNSKKVDTGVNVPPKTVVIKTKQPSEDYKEKVRKLNSDVIALRGSTKRSRDSSASDKMDSDITVQSNTALKDSTAITKQTDKTKEALQEIHQVEDLSSSHQTRTRSVNKDKTVSDKKLTSRSSSRESLNINRSRHSSKERINVDRSRHSSRESLNVNRSRHSSKEGINVNRSRHSSKESVDSIAGKATDVKQSSSRRLSLKDAHKANIELKSAETKLDHKTDGKTRSLRNQDKKANSSEPSNSSKESKSRKSDQKSPVTKTSTESIESTTPTTRLKLNLRDKDETHIEKLESPKDKTKDENSDKTDNTRIRSRSSGKYEKANEKLNSNSENVIVKSKKSESVIGKIDLKKVSMAQKSAVVENPKLSIESTSLEKVSPNQKINTELTTKTISEIQGDRDVNELRKSKRTEKRKDEKQTEEKISRNQKINIPLTEVISKTQEEVNELRKSKRKEKRKDEEQTKVLNKSPVPVDSNAKLIKPSVKSTAKTELETSVVKDLNTAVKGENQRKRKSSVEPSIESKKRNSSNDDNKIAQMKPDTGTLDKTSEANDKLPENVAELRKNPVKKNLEQRIHELRNNKRLKLETKRQNDVRKKIVVISSQVNKTIVSNVERNSSVKTNVSNVKVLEKPETVAENKADSKIEKIHTKEILDNKKLKVVSTASTQQNVLLSPDKTLKDTVNETTNIQESENTKSANKEVDKPLETPAVTVKKKVKPVVKNKVEKYPEEMRLENETDEDFKKRKENVKLARRNSAVGSYESDFNFDNSKATEPPISTPPPEEPQCNFDNLELASLYSNNTSSSNGSKNSNLGREILMARCRADFANDSKPPSSPRYVGQAIKIPVSGSPQKTTVSEMASKLAQGRMVQVNTDVNRLSPDMFAKDRIKKYSRRPSSDKMLPAITTRPHPSPTTMDNMKTVKSPKKTIKLIASRPVLSKGQLEKERSEAKVCAVQVAAAQTQMSKESNSGETLSKVKSLHDQRKDDSPFRWEKSPSRETRSSSKPDPNKDVLNKSTKDGRPDARSAQKTEVKVENQNQNFTKPVLETVTTKDATNTKKSNVKDSDSNTSTKRARSVEKKTEAEMKARTGESDESDNITEPPTKQCKLDGTATTPEKKTNTIGTEAHCEHNIAKSTCNHCRSLNSPVKKRLYETTRPEVRHIKCNGKIVTLNKNGSITEMPILENPLPKPNPMLRSPIAGSSTSKETPMMTATRRKRALSPEEGGNTTMREERASSLLKGEGKSHKIDQFICDTLNEIRKEREHSNLNNARWQLKKEKHSPKYPYTFKKSKQFN